MVSICRLVVVLLIGQGIFPAVTLFANEGSTFCDPVPSGFSGSAPLPIDTSAFASAAVAPTSSMKEETRKNANRAKAASKIDDPEAPNLFNIFLKGASELKQAFAEYNRGEKTGPFFNDPKYREALERFEDQYPSVNFEELVLKEAEDSRRVSDAVATKLFPGIFFPWLNPFTTSDNLKKARELRKKGKFGYAWFANQEFLAAPPELLRQRLFDRVAEIFKASMVGKTWDDLPSAPGVLLAHPLQWRPKLSEQGALTNEMTPSAPKLPLPAASGDTDLNEEVLVETFVEALGLEATNVAQLIVSSQDPSFFYDPKGIAHVLERARAGDLSPLTISEGITLEYIIALDKKYNGLLLSSSEIASQVQPQLKDLNNRLNDLKDSLSQVTQIFRNSDLKRLSPQEIAELLEKQHQANLVAGRADSVLDPGNVLRQLAKTAHELDRKIKEILNPGEERSPDIRSQGEALVDAAKNDPSVLGGPPLGTKENARPVPPLEFIKPPIEESPFL